MKLKQKNREILFNFVAISKIPSKAQRSLRLVGKHISSFIKLTLQKYYVNTYKYNHFWLWHTIFSETFLTMSKIIIIMHKSINPIRFATTQSKAILGRSTTQLLDDQIYFWKWLYDKKLDVLRRMIIENVRKIKINFILSARLCLNNDGVFQNFRIT